MLIYLAIYFIASIAVAVAAVALWLKIVLSLLIFLDFFLNIRKRVKLNQPQSITFLSWDVEKKHLRLWQKNDSILRVNHLTATVLPFAVCLLCKIQGRILPVPVIIFRDTCNTQAFRRLRVLALHGQMTLSNQN